MKLENRVLAAVKRRSSNLILRREARASQHHP